MKMCFVTKASANLPKLVWRNLPKTRTSELQKIQEQLIYFDLVMHDREVDSHSIFLGLHYIGTSSNN